MTEPAGVEAQRLIDWKINHGRKHLEVREKTYDNSAAPLVVPAGFRLIGECRDTSKILTGTTGEPVVIGPYASAEQIIFESKDHIPNPGLGRSPMPGGYGVTLAPKARLSHCFLAGFHTGVVLRGDHQLVEDCETLGCFAGLFRPGGGSRGNLKLYNNRFTGSTFCGFFIGRGTEEDSLESFSNHWGFQPIGWYAENGPDQREFGMTNVLSVADSFESHGNRHIQMGRRRISGDLHTPRTGPLEARYRIASDEGNVAPTLGTEPTHVFESVNVTGRDAAGNWGLFGISGSGGDEWNGPFIAGGSVGVFKANR